MALDVNLSQERAITTVPEQVKNLTSLTVTRMVDSPEEQTVTVFVQELRQSIVLWSGATAYTTCGANGDGQWTDADVIAELQSIYDV